MKILSMALVVASCTALAQVPASKPALSVLEGHVVKDPGSLPVKKAEVTLMTESEEGRTTYSAISNADGYFHMEGIRPGRYRAFVERSGMVEVGRQGRRSPGTAVSFTPGADVTGIVLHMLPAAVIVGRVLDEDGDPMAGTDVSVLRRGYTLGQRRLETAASGTTNDLGEYRIPDLLPGQYLVLASPTPEFLNVTAASASTQSMPAGKNIGYVPTYYPGTSERSQAAPLELRPGDEVPVDFNLVPSPTFHLRGSLANFMGDRDSTAMLVLRPKDSNTEFAAAQVDREGKFDIAHVPPGSYTLWALARRADSPQVAHQPVEVTNGDIENLRIVPLPANRIHGHVRAESGQSLDLNSLVVFLRSTEGDSRSAFAGDQDLSTTVARVKRDGAFEISSVPAGSYSVVIEDSGTNTDFYLKSASVGSSDVTDSGFNVGGGGTYALELLVRKGAARLEGRVTDSDSKPVADASVVLVPEGSHHERFELYAKTLTDQHGHFAFSGLTPGEYAAFAFESIEEGAYYDDAFLKPYEARGVKIHLDENGKKTTQLSLIPGSDD